MGLQSDMLALKRRADHWVFGARARSFGGTLIAVMFFTHAAFCFDAGLGGLGAVSFSSSVAVALMAAWMQRQANVVEDEFAGWPSRTLVRPAA